MALIKEAFERAFDALRERRQPAGRALGPKSQSSEGRRLVHTWSGLGRHERGERAQEALLARKNEPVRQNERLR